MTILQLNPPIPMYCVGNDFFPTGTCMAFFLNDKSQEHDDSWKCCFDVGGAWYDIPNQLIRAQINATLYRKMEVIK